MNNAHMHYVYVILQCLRTRVRNIRCADRYPYVSIYIYCVQYYYVIFICIHYLNVCVCSGEPPVYIIMHRDSYCNIVFILLYVCAFFFPVCRSRARARAPAAGQTAAASLYCYYVRRYNLNNNFFFSHFLQRAPEIIQMS